MALSFASRNALLAGQGTSLYKMRLPTLARSHRLLCASSARKSEKSMPETSFINPEVHKSDIDFLKSIAGPIRL